jgi:hypothetical protein
MCTLPVVAKVNPVSLAVIKSSLAIDTKGVAAAPIAKHPKRGCGSGGISAKQDLVELWEKQCFDVGDSFTRSDPWLLVT